MAIPEFNTDGNLPPGIHVADWDEFATRFAITSHRKRLTTGLRAAILIFGRAGCKRFYIDGSFVTKKAVPNDYDAAWEPTGVDLNLLKSLEPVFFDFANLRAAQKAKYFGEFFPSNVRANLVGTTFLDFFQVDRNTGNAKGIIALELQGGTT